MNQYDCQYQFLYYLSLVDQGLKNSSSSTQKVTKQMNENENEDEEEMVNALEMAYQYGQQLLKNLYSSFDVWN